MRTHLGYVFILAVGITSAILFATITNTTIMEQHIEQVDAAVLSGQWDDASTRLSHLTAEWERRRPWLQLTKSVDQIFDIDRLLARLNAAIRTESAPDAAGLIAEIEELWLDLKG